MQKLMISCRQATEMLAKKEEGKVSFANLFRLWYHTFICTCCKKFTKQDKLIVNHLKKITDNMPTTSLTDKEKNEMIEKLQNH